MSDREYCYQKYGSLSIPQMLAMIQARDDTIERLISHASILGTELAGDRDCADQSNDSWRSLPPELQEKLNTETIRLMEQDGE